MDPSTPGLASRPSPSPWLFVPVLYAMQAIPVTLTQEVSTVLLKDLKYDNVTIATWTSLVSLPWTLKLFVAPIVEWNWTRRLWVLVAQVILAVLLLAQAAAVTQSDPLAVLVVLLFAIAISSAVHDIAADGLYLATVPRDQQPAMSGVQVTAYRLGRLFCVGAVVWLAGWMTNRIELDPPQAWSSALGIAAGVYLLGLLWNLFVLRRFASSTAPRSSDATLGADLGRALLAVGLGVAIYYLIKSSLLLAGDLLTQEFVERSILLEFPPRWALEAELRQRCLRALLICPPILLGLALWMRRLYRGTEMARAFGSFVRQSGFVWVVLFLMTYRLGEAMVSKMSPLFYRDAPTAGGLGLDTESVGQIVGFVGVPGILLGGLAGGWYIGKRGLRGAFLPLLLSMALPNLLYVWTAATHPPKLAVAAVAFVDQFGFGFGFAGYIVYLMYVAQRDRYPTTHYAILTGLGALGTVLAGIASAIIQNTLSYVGLFIISTLAVVPAGLVLLYIPMDNNATRTIRPTPKD